LSSSGSWPGVWKHNELVGQSEHVLYVTPQEASELGNEIFRLVRRYDARVDHPERRPADAMPIEILTLAYPLPGPGQPGGGASAAGEPGRPVAGSGGYGGRGARE
jgi:hypothetical protein